MIFRAEDPGRRRKAKKGAGAEAGCKSEASRLEGYGKLVTSPAICAKNLSICVEYETAQLSLENQSLALHGLPRRTSTSEDITTYQYEDLAADQRFLGQIDLESQMRFNPVIEEQATTFFFNNFVLSPRAPDITRGFLEVAAPLFHATVDGSSLHLATQAHSLLVIAHWPGRKHLRDRAQQLYSQALKAIQKDLQDSRKATSDDTVLAVLILSLFEATNAGRDPAGAQAWARHIEGATTLVRARGATQFDNPKSHMVFRAVRTQMLTNAVQQRKPLPDFPDGWTSDLDGKESAASALIKYSILLPDLLARAKRIFAAERTMDSFAQVQILLGEAFEMQGRLTDWEHSMPPQWGYRSLAITPEPVDADQIEHLEAWPGVLHIYRDVHTACIRNNNRVTQMYYCTIVIDALKWLFGEKFDTDERYYASMYRLQTLVDEICYSVPFHLYGAEAANGVRHIDRIQNGKPSQRFRPFHVLTIPDSWPSSWRLFPHLAPLRCLEHRRCSLRAAPLATRPPRQDCSALRLGSCWTCVFYQ